MLANVQRMQMEPEGAHLQNERVDERARDANSVICGKRIAQHLKVAEKILYRAVSRQYLRQLFVSARQGVRSNRHGSTGGAKALPSKFERALNARLHADDE